MSQQLTVVLPMYNNERMIRSTIQNILDVQLHAQISFDLVIVDDGSTDDTYEAACELACKYPQVQVLRLPFRSGLAAVLDLVRNRLAVELVILHDGVSQIRPEELRNLLLDEQGNPRTAKTGLVKTQAGLDSYGSRRFGAMRALQNSMENAHRQIAGFNWLELEKPLVPRRRLQTDKLNQPPLRTSERSMPLPTILAELPTGFSAIPVNP